MDKNWDTYFGTDVDDPDAIHEIYRNLYSAVNELDTSMEDKK